MSANFKKASDLILQGEKHVTSNPQKSIDALTKALNHLDLLTNKEIENLSADEYYTNYGWCYKYGLMALEQLGEAEQAQLFAEDCLLDADDFDVDESTFESQDYAQMRFAIRRAHIVLAKVHLAANKHTLAIKNIKKCFAIKSFSGEHENPFLHFYQAAAQVYLAAFTLNPQKYQQDFFKALYQLEAQAKLNAHLVKIDDPALRTFLADKSYLAHKADKPIEKLRAAAQNETWQQALKRFQQMHQLLKLAPPDKGAQDWNALTIKPPVDEAKLAGLAQKNQCQVPAPLRALLLKQGPFEMRDKESWQSLRLYSSFDEYEMPVFGGLQKMIDELWGGRPEFTDYFTEQELAYLNSHYFIFGHFVKDSNAHYHLYFTPQGEFGSIYYDQDNWDKMEPLVRSLLKNKGLKHASLDALISEFTTMAIEGLIEVKNELDYSA